MLINRLIQFYCLCITPARGERPYITAFWQIKLPISKLPISAKSVRRCISYWHLIFTIFWLPESLFSQTNALINQDNQDNKKKELPKQVVRSVLVPDWLVVSCIIVSAGAVLNIKMNQNIVLDLCFPLFYLVVTIIAMKLFCSKQQFEGLFLLLCAFSYWHWHWSIIYCILFFFFIADTMCQIMTDLKGAKESPLQHM